MSTAPTLPQIEVVRLIDQGFEVFPCRSDKSPATTRGFKDASKCRRQVATWLRSNPALWGLPCEANRLFVIDIDAKHRAGAEELLRQRFAELELQHLLAKAVHQATPSGGAHLVFRVRPGESPGNQKLARAAGAKEAFIETRGKGGYICAYADLELSKAGVLIPEEIEDVLSACRSLDEAVEEPRQRTERTAQQASGVSPGDAFNASPDAEEEVATLLRSHGWEHVTGRRWRRPGKASGVSADLREDGCFYVYTSSTTFEPGKAYSPFAAYALLEHAGDYSAAASTLRARGYGESAQPNTGGVDLSGIMGRIGKSQKDFTNTPPPPFKVDWSAPTPARQQTSSVTWPDGTPLDQYLEFAREFSEAPDKILVGSLLPILSACLGRRVWVDFGGSLYPNLFALIAAPPGFRKSTTIGLAERIGRELLLKDAFTSSIASEEALFKEYEVCADKLLIEDEGNSLLSNWANTSYGKIVAKRYLKLFDCKPFQVSFMKNLKQGESTVQLVEQTSTSAVVGATLNVADFQGLESADGLRRRFLTYLFDAPARTIYFPRGFDRREIEAIAQGFRPLLSMRGRFTFSQCGRERFIQVQDENRAKLAAKGLSQAEASLLAGEPAFIVKVATLYAALRRANSPNSTNSTGGELTGELLEIAATHLNERLNDAKNLNKISQIEAIAREADSILETVRSTFCGLANDEGDIVVTKSQLVRTFCKNPSRDADYRERMYRLYIPDLIERGLCQEVATEGKGQRYAFRGEE